MASRSSPYSLHALTTFLSILLAPSALCLGAEARHDGKSHRHVQLRQERPPAAAIVNDPAPELGFTSTPAAAPTMMSQPSLTTPFSFSSTYSFPSTVLQIPIATVCPGTPAISAPFQLVPVPLVGSLSGNATSLNNTYPNATDYLPIPAPQSTRVVIPLNATAFLAKGSTTTFLSYTTSNITLTPATPTPDSTARIVLDTNGCQTLYSPTTTAICRTMVSVGGQLPIPVTDCGQLVTFSSQAIRAGCAGASASMSGQAIGGATAYFAAPWYQIATGEVPDLVQVADCVNGMGGRSCSTSSEVWSISTRTSTVTQISTVGFTGAAILTHSGQTLTTTLTVDEMTTSTSMLLVPTIVRVKIAQETVTVVQSRATVVQTWELDRVVRSTVTVYLTQMAHLTETATMTR